MQSYPQVKETLPERIISDNDFNDECDEIDEQICQCHLQLMILIILCIHLFTLMYDSHIIRNIKDPEYNYTLEQLDVVSLNRIHVNTDKRTINVKIVPTVPQCGLISIIGLAVKAKLLLTLPLDYIINVNIKEETHQQWKTHNARFADKERIYAALDNYKVFPLIMSCWSGVQDES
ncbi:MIP18 family protein FAM96A [Intoshia linei]|uniref:MIP18 family protein FAM96A n=1 Tax=Intoshia linei TaxID=1819745 RepID=A0A177AU73_9BILA|nr:MIP18 family protein FAM96A [Intoshia linei]